MNWDLTLAVLVALIGGAGVSGLTSLVTLTKPARSHRRVTQLKDVREALAPDSRVRGAVNEEIDDEVSALLLHLENAPARRRAAIALTFSVAIGVGSIVAIYVWRDEIVEATGPGTTFAAFVGGVLAVISLTLLFYALRIGMREEFPDEDQVDGDSPGSGRTE